MRKQIRTLIITILLVHIFFYIPSTQASQSSGHLFFAEQMREGPIRKYLSGDNLVEQQYFLGSLGIDSFWIAHLGTSLDIQKLLREKHKISLPQNLALLTHPIPDIHRSKPIEMTLSLLSQAENPQESAYALGWVSHFITDTHIHDLVNQWGGYSEISWDQNDANLTIHNRLEALESRYIFDRYGHILPVPALKGHDLQTPPDFMLRSLAATYPAISNYKPVQQQALIKTLHQSELLMKLSSQWFHYQATHTPREIHRTKHLIHRFRPQLGHMMDFLNDLPPRQSYTTSPPDLAFLQQWEQRHEDALRSSREIIPLCMIYLWTHQRHSADGVTDALAAERLRQIEAKLKALSPLNDLLKPREFYETQKKK